MSTQPAAIDLKKAKDQGLMLSIFAGFFLIAVVPVLLAMSFLSTSADTHKLLLGAAILPMLLGVGLTVISIRLSLGKMKPFGSTSAS